MRYIVRLTCCGRDDGTQAFGSWREANAFRESYETGEAVHPHGYSAPEHEPGHRRAGILAVDEPGGQK